MPKTEGEKSFPGKKPPRPLVMPEPPPRRRWLIWPLLMLVLVLGFALGFREIHSPDIGFHLASGEWILEHGKVPTSDILSFTFTDHDYIDLQWLFQLLLVGAHRAGGVPLVLLGKIALTFSFWGLLLYRTHRRTGRIPLAAVLLLVPIALSDLWEERPQLLSWNFGCLILLALEEHARGNRRWLPVLPAVMLLWVNSHSLFVLGLVCIGAYAGWELLIRRCRDQALAVCALASVAACFANPYFVQGFQLPLVQFFEIQGDSPFNLPSIGLIEFQSPFAFSKIWFADRFVPFSQVVYWQIFLLGAVIGHGVQFRRLSAFERILFLGFLYIFVSASKNFGYFVMATFPVVSTGLSAAWGSLMGKVSGPSNARRRITPERLRLALAACASLAVIFLTWAAASGVYYALDWTAHKPGARVNRQYLPVAAAEFIRTHQIKGNILCCFEGGGYLAWRTGQKVSVYGIAEVLGPGEYVRYVMGLGSSGTAEYLRSVNPDIAVGCLQHTGPWLLHLSTSPDWRLVHLEDSFAVFLKKGVAGHVPDLPKPVPGKDYPVIQDSEIGEILNRAARLPGNTWRDWWRGSLGYPVSEVASTHMYRLTGQPMASASFALDALRKNDRLDLGLFLALGDSYESLGNVPLALLCYQNYLLHINDPAIASHVMKLKTGINPVPRN